MFTEGYILFSGDGCANCKSLKEKLNNKNIEFKEYDIWENADALKFIVSKGYKTIPQLFKDGEKVEVDKL